MRSPLLAAALLTTVALAACGSDSVGTSPSPSVVSGAGSTPTTAGSSSCPPAAAAGAPDDFHATVALQPGPQGLQMGDFNTGSGPAAQSGQHVYVHYTGWLQSDGTKFDSSRDRGKPFDFTLGQGVIEGWSLGVAGMKVGGKRRLVIPPALGYGTQGSPPAIPPNATLVFDVELLAIC